VAQDGHVGGQVWSWLLDSSSQKLVELARLIKVNRAGDLLVLGCNRLASYLNWRTAYLRHDPQVIPLYKSSTIGKLVKPCAGSHKDIKEKSGHFDTQ
jgi:hypothetical protein